MAAIIDAAVILAGGTAVRLGGVSKPDYTVAGRRLIEILLSEFAANAQVGRIVVVAPGSVDVPPGVVLTLEDPPLGGPLAGVAAGVAELSDLPDDALVALATCDAPLAPRLLTEMVAALGSDSDGVVPVTADDEGWAQYLHGLYTLGALRKVPRDRDRSIRSAFRGLSLTQLVDEQDHCIDVDTPADAARLEARLSAS